MVAHVLIERAKVYPRPARPGHAWRWVYTVVVPGEPHTFSGDRLAWARRLARSKAPELPVLLAWERPKGGEAWVGR